MNELAKQRLSVTFSKVRLLLQLRMPVPRTDRAGSLSTCHRGLRATCVRHLFVTVARHLPVRDVTATTRHALVLHWDRCDRGASSIPITPRRRAAIRRACRKAAPRSLGSAIYGQQYSVV